MNQLKAKDRLVEKLFFFSFLTTVEKKAIIAGFFV